MSVLGGNSSSGGFTTSGSGGKQDADKEIWLNITPMVDIMTSLLFFLMMAFGAVIIALINASTPVISDGDPDPTVSKLKVTLGMNITDKGIQVTASHDKLSEEELARLKKFFPRGKEGYNFSAINDYIYGIKKKFPDSASAVLTPKPDITYSTLIEAMDASREKVVQKAKMTLRIPLFPEAVVSSLVE